MSTAEAIVFSVSIVASLAFMAFVVWQQNKE